MSRKGTGEIWTDTQIERLCELWADGVPAPKIGDAVGKSRCAVLGKAFRLGLERRTPPRAAYGSIRLTATRP